MHLYICTYTPRAEAEFPNCRFAFAQSRWRVWMNAQVVAFLCISAIWHGTGSQDDLGNVLKVSCKEVMKMAKQWLSRRGGTISEVDAR